MEENKNHSIVVSSEEVSKTISDTPQSDIDEINKDDTDKYGQFRVFESRKET